ncbi:hypothetical protein, partial [Planobispora rosea]|uniref:hypothetical protein n=1 Tax=Planobispora rosea TaxID=35762 RepID=UPI0019444E39
MKQFDGIVGARVARQGIDDDVTFNVCGRLHPRSCLQLERGIMPGGGKVGLGPHRGAFPERPRTGRMSAS